MPHRNRWGIFNFMATFHGANNAINVGSLLTNNIASGTATPTIGVSTGDGVAFGLIPVPFYVTLALAAETEDGVTDVVEVFNVTAVVADNLTTDARGISNTTALDWSIGDKVQVRVVDLQFKELGDEINLIETGAILTNASINAAAAIATTKLADGAEFLQRDGSVVITGDLDFDGFTGINVVDPTNPQDIMTKAYADATYLNIDGSVLMTGDLDVDSNSILNVATAVATTDAANLAVVQTYTYERTYKDACDWGTTGDINLTGLAVQANGEWTGALTGGDRIFVLDQTSPIENGIYTAAAVAWARSADADSDAEWANGLVSSVRQGATLAGTSWKCTNAAVTLGVTNITFEAFAVSTIDIGSPISGGTDGSVLFIDAGLLAENNADFFWNNATNVLTISNSTSSPFVGAVSTAATNSEAIGATISHESSGTPAAGFGAHVSIGLHDDTNLLVANAGTVGVKWTDPSTGATESAITFGTKVNGVTLVRALIEGNGSVAMQTAGATLKVKEGANACMGTATLAAGTAAVSTTAVTASSRIFISRQEGGTPADFGHLQVDNVVASTGFDINSTDVADDSVVAWIIIEPS